MELSHQSSTRILFFYPIKINCINPAIKIVIFKTTVDYHQQLHTILLTLHLTFVNMNQYE